MCIEFLFLFKIQFVLTLKATLTSYKDRKNTTITAQKQLRLYAAAIPG